MKRPLLLSFRPLCFFATSLLGVSSNSRAATNLFQGPGTSWNALGNWSLGTVPAATNALLLNGTSPLTSSLDANFTSQTLSFDTGANNLNLNANGSGTTARVLTLTGGTNALGGTELIATSATTAGIFNVGTTAGLGTFGIALNTAGSIHVANAGANLILGANSIVSGSAAVTKTGAGTLTLSGANTFTGDINLSGGTLVSSSLFALGKNTNTSTYKQLFLTNNATFRSGTFNDNTPATTTQTALVFNIGSGGGTLDVTSGGLLTIDDGSGNGTAAAASQLQGSGTLTKVGDGSLSLGNGTSNFSVFTGQILVNQGTLIYGGGTSAFGDTAANTVVASGAVLDVRGTTGLEPLDISGTGISSGGALITSTGTGTVGGPVALATGTSIGGAAALNITGVVTAASGFTKVGTGATVLSGANAATIGGTVTVSAGNLGASNPGITNVIEALGTASVSLNTGTLALKANGSASYQTITFTNPVTLGGTATIDVNRFGANSNSIISLNNLSVGANQLNVLGANGYALGVTNNMSIGGATFNSTTAPLYLQGKLSDAGTGFSVIGTGSTRFTNTAAGAGANALSGPININGGTLQGFARVADAATSGSSSLGTSDIALSGTNPTLRLTPSLEGGLNTAASAGLIDRSFTNVTSLGGTNFLGATQPVTTGAGGQNPTGVQTVSQVNIATAVTATNTSHQYTGLINITTAGMYTFQSFTDDGGNLIIDGNAPIATANTTATGTVYLSAGLHTLTNRWNNVGGNGGDVMSYQGPDTANAMIVIPAGVLSNATTAQLATTFNNNITYAAGSNATVDMGAVTTIPSLNMTGTGAGTTLNVSGSGDLNTLTVTGSSAITDSATFNISTANLILNNGLTTTGGPAFNLTKNGAGALTVINTFAPTGQINLNAGTLSLALDGPGSNGTIAEGNPVFLNGTPTFDVRNGGGANTGNTIAMGNLVTPATAAVTTTTFTGANGYNLSFTGLALPGTSGASTTLVPNSTNVIIAGNVTNQMSGFLTTNFDTLFLDGTTTGNQIQGNISDAVGGSFTPLAGGYTRLYKTNTSTWTISGTGSTYTGITRVENGTLKAGAANVIPLTNLQGIQIAATGAGATATYDFNGFNQTLNGATALALSGTTTTSKPQVLGAGSTVTLNGNVTYTSTNNPLGGLISVDNLNLGGGNRTIDVGLSTSAGTVSSPDLDISSDLTNGSITKTGAGVLRLTGDLNLTGITGNAGTIAITSATTINSTPFTVNGSILDLGGTTQNLGNFTLASGSIVNGTLSGGTTFLKQGAGTLALNVAVTGLNSVTVNQGAQSTTTNPATYSNLALNFAAAGVPATDIVNATSTLTLGGTATSVLGGGQISLLGAAAGTNSQSFVSTVISGGASAATLTPGAGGTMGLGLGTLTRSTGGTVDFTLPAGTQSASNGVTLANPGTAATLLTSANGTAFATVAGNDWAANSTDSPGNIVSASVAGAGGTSIYTAASNAATFTGNADVTTSFAATSGSTVNSIRMNTGTSTLTLAGVNTVTSGGILFGSGASGISIITGGTIRPGAGQELVILNNKPNTLNAIASVLADGASGATTVTYRANLAGATGGTFDIRANNTYTGPTFITSGRVATQTTAVTTPFGTGPNAIVYVDGSSDGQFFSNLNTTIANPFVIVGNGLNENGVRLGAIRLNSTAAITPILSGTITLAGDASIGNSAAISGAGSALISGNILTSNVLGATSFALTKVGSGVIRLTGSGNSQTATNIAAGMLSINADAALGVSSAPLTFTGAGSLQFQNAITLGSTRNIIHNAAATYDTSLVTASAATNISGVISGTGALTKSYTAQGFATNPLILSGVNTFTGNVTVASGWLTATNSSSFGTGTKTITVATNASSDSIHLDPSLGATPGVAIDLPASQSFTLSNDTFTGANEGTIVNESGNNFIRGALTLSSGGGGTILASRSGTLNLTGNITTNATGRALKLRGDGTGVISGNISDGTTVQLPVSRDLGTGTWTLSGNNTYGGETNVQSGALKLGSVTALGSQVVYQPGTAATGTTVSAGASLDLNGNAGIQERITLNGTGIGGAGALINTSATGASLSNGLSSLGYAATSGASSTTVTISGGGGTGATATANLGVTTTTFAINGGTTVYSAAPTVTIAGGGGTTAATATAVLTAGVVTGITITNAGAGYSTAPTITFSAGTVTTAGTNPTGTGNATNFAINSVTLTNQGSGYTSAPTLTNGTATFTAVNSQIQLASNSSIGGTGNITLNGPITETGGSRTLAKVGSNNLILNGASTFTGLTTVSAGQLTVNGSLLAGVNVGNSAILAGAGSIGGAVALDGGILSPGNSPGLLTVGGSLTTTNSSQFKLELAGNAPAAGYDQISANGFDLGTGSGATILTLTSSFTPALNDVFYLGINTSASAITGTFFGIPEGGLIVDNAGNNYTVTYQANWGGTQGSSTTTGGNDFAAIATVPEAGQVLLTALASLGLLTRRKRN